MTITPFPPRVLAELVLGYLAEEQLMTAYDEFLQGSPYLDALENEHDRLFMTPLRYIVAEYRAVKMYVENCKPFGLRRRLIGCSNLLEAVKLLVQFVDTDKVRCQDRLSYDSVKGKTRVNNLCDVCSSLNRTSCACHILSKSNASVEATLLEDLPGHPSRKKHVKVLSRDKTSSSPAPSYELPLCSKNPEDSSSASLDPDVVIVDTPTVYRQETYTLDIQSRNSHSVVREVSNAKQKIENNHTTLSIVANSSQYKTLNADQLDRHSSSAAGTFQDFATGVEGKNTVPDSSILESLNSVIPVTNEDNNNKVTNEDDKSSKKEFTKAHILLTVENQNYTSSQLSTTKTTDYALLRPKSNEQKITILSDIKVDKGYGGGSEPRIPAVLRGATSTPCAQLQTIMINGTPAFRHERRPHGYTRDEINAMPTFILMPASSAAAAGQQQNLKNVCSLLSNTETVSSAPHTISSTARSLGPLLIDVDSSASAKNRVNIQNAESTDKLKNASDPLTNKTDELNSENDVLTAKASDFKNATVPKDTEASNKSTPQTISLPRKSSSTPRRSSHVRVLDFTTPRRILHEAIPEHPTTDDNPVDVIISKSPSLHTLANPKEPTDTNKTNLLVLESVNKSDECLLATQSIQKIITVKKSDWDADLRALAVANAKHDAFLDNPKKKPKSSRRKKGSENKPEVEKSQEKKRRKSTTTKSATKIKLKSLEIIEDSVDTVEEPIVPLPVTIKPTINIITEHDWGTIPQSEDPDKNKSNNEDETDTPEMERLSLQNAVGAKLNISDLLETPYKQALYDIQMETPKFLGPDLPGDPMSDIKIMNIPTPRFLNTPKPPLATPSSYSSRQTDYSSGGSYYKPDDHDEIDLGYPVIKEAEEPKENPPENKDVSKNNSKDKIFKSNRPVRKCTKNVSYVNSPNIKAKESDKADASGSSETSLNEPAQPTKDLKCKTPKAETKRKSSVTKKRKTPVKKETPKSFMKIKPRRPTPVKDSGRKRKSGTSGRKRTSSRDKDDSDTTAGTTAVVSAPTKSRRKSSTPRKLHRTKQFHSEGSDHDSPEMKRPPTRNSSASGVPDSDAENPPLRWSDDGSQEPRPSEVAQPPPTEDKLLEETSTKPRQRCLNETDDITKIQEYLADSAAAKPVPEVSESSLHIDLVKRGFDIETAKIIERDLLDTPPYPKDNAVTTTSNVECLAPETNKQNKVEGSVQEKAETVGSTSVNVEIEEEEEEIELTGHECNEETENYIVCHHDDTKDIPRKSPEKLKDKFCMEVCIDDGMAIRLKATPLTYLIDEDPKDVERSEYHRETEMAVSSISSMEKLYTPMKDPRAQCYEIFDSTLTSLDTPLKADTPKKRDHEMTVTEIVMEVEEVENFEVKSKVETKARKRALSGNGSDESTGENKKPKPDPQYLLNPANIKNIDIETVLCKLHGP